MLEQQPTSSCPHCGYPAEIGEHAVDCPNANSEDQFGVGELTSSEENQASAEGKTFAKSEVGVDQGENEKRKQALEKIKRVARRLVTWGMIYGSSLITFDQLFKQAELNNVPAEKPTLSEYYGKKDRMAQVLPPDTPVEEVQKIRQAYEGRVEEFNRQLLECRQEIEYLENVYGHDYLDQIISDAYQAQTISQEVIDQSEIESETKFVSQGFEQLGLKSQRVQEICQTTFPRNWVVNEVDSLIYVDHKAEKDSGSYDKYNLGEGWSTAAMARSKDHGITTIDVYSAFDQGYAFEKIGHELGHANDWSSDNNMTLEQKLKLMSEVSRRYLEGDNIYQSNYVQSIDNPDPDANTRIKIEEYWAEICGAYFSDPAMLKIQNPQDFELVNKWVHIQDPKSEFDPYTKSEVRKKLISTYANEYSEQMRQEKWESLPESLRAEADGIAARMAFDIEKQKFLMGGTGWTTFGEAQHLLIQYQIMENNYEITYLVQEILDKKIDELRKIKSNEWKNQLRQDFLSNLPPQAREDLIRLKEQFTVEVEKKIQEQGDSFDWGVQQSKTLEELEIVRGKYGIENTAEGLFLNVLMANS